MTFMKDLGASKSAEDSSWVGQYRCWPEYKIKGGKTEGWWGGGVVHMTPTV